MARNARRLVFGHNAATFIGYSGPRPQFAFMMRSLATITLVVSISGCAATDFRQLEPQPAGTSRNEIVRPSEHPGSRIAEQALAMVGSPYLYGGASPNTGFDCSGLVYYSFRENGFSVPRTSREQYRAARKIALREALEGDILFFEDEAKLSHIGIYIGDGRFVHAPESGRTVSVAQLDSPYYQRHLIGVGRLLP